MNSRKILLLASTLVLSVAANAKEEGWSGKVNLGYLATSGNTENSSLNSAFGLEYDSEKWEHLFHMAAIRASENDETTAQAFEASWKSEYSVADDNYVFGRVKWSKDKFSGYDQQVSETVGYGRRILDTDVHQLSAELGIGAAQSDLRDGTSEDDFIGRAAANYKWVLNSTAEFQQDLSVESGADNTYMESVSAIKTTLIGSLSLVASYTIKSNSQVPEGTAKTDTFTALSLEYRF